MNRMLDSIFSEADKDGTGTFSYLPTCDGKEVNKNPNLQDYLALRRTLGEDAEMVAYDNKVIVPYKGDSYEIVLHPSKDDPCEFVGTFVRM